MAKKKNPKIPSPNDEDSGFSPNQNTNPPPPSSVIPLDDANLNKFFAAIEKMGASMEKTNALLSEKKSIESGVGAFSPEEKKQLEEITQKLQEEIALQNDVLLEMRQAKNSISGVQSDLLPVSAKESTGGVISEKMELSQVLKKENDVLTTLNTNIVELRTLQDEVKEVVIKNYEKTISLAGSDGVARKIKTGGTRGSGEDAVAKTIQNEIKDDELLSNDKKMTSVDSLQHQQVIERLDRLYAANTAEMLLIKTMVDQQKIQGRQEFESKIEEESKLDTDATSAAEYHEEQLAAHEESTDELLESNKEINSSLKEMLDHQKEKAEHGLFNSLRHFIWHVIKTMMIYGGIGVALGAVAAYVVKYVREMQWLLSPLTNLIKRGFNSTETGAFILKGFTSIFEAIKLPIVSKFNQIKNLLFTFAEGTTVAIKGLESFGIVGVSIASAGRIISGILGALGAPMMGLLGGFFNLGYMIKGVRLGFRGAMQVLNKIFWPLQILISVIDGVIGAIKGFKLGGVKGAVMGAVAEIIDGLTFGLLDFEMMFHFFNEYMSTFFDGLTAAIQPTINLFTEVWDIMVDLWNDFVSLFTEDGGWGEKIGKILGSLIGALVRLVVSIGEWVGTTMYNALWEFPYQIGVWLNETIVRLYDWIASGEFIEDIASVFDKIADFLLKIYDSFFETMMRQLAKLPGFMGESIAGMFGPAGLLYYNKAVVDAAKEKGKKEKQEQQKEKEKTNSNFSDFSTNLVQFSKDLPSIFENMFNEDDGGGLESLLAPFGDNLDSFIEENAKNMDVALSKAGVEGDVIPLKPRAEYVSSDKIKGMAMMVGERTRPQAASVVSINSPTNISSGGSQQPIMISPVSSRNNDPTYHGLGLASAVAY